MACVFLVCGATGAGKTTYSIALAAEQRAVRFSLDPWMQTLFGADMTALSYAWMLERVARCERQIWDVVPQLLGLGTNVVLDLGLMTTEQRARHRVLAVGHGADALVHFVDTPASLRRERVGLRNHERDPTVFAFEVTEQMFDFMEPRFEPPSEAELVGGRRVTPPARVARAGD